MEKQVKLKGQLRMGGADGLLGLTQRYSDLLLVLRQIDNARFGETINVCDQPGPLARCGRMRCRESC